MDKSSLRCSEVIDGRLHLVLTRYSLYRLLYAISTQDPHVLYLFQHLYTASVPSSSISRGSDVYIYLFLATDAHIVCSTAKTRYNPDGSSRGSDTGSQDGWNRDLESHKLDYKPVHANQATRMWFMVCLAGSNVSFMTYLTMFFVK